MLHDSPPALEDALRYASIGWHVFPTRPDKRPYTEHGFLDASVDAEILRAWWHQWPDARVGIACLASGLFVVDLDKRPDKARNGVDAWSMLQDEHGSDGASLVAVTPSGGQHIVYLHPGTRITTVNNVIPASGIDVRGDGGYFIAPSAADPGRSWKLGDPFEADGDGKTDLQSAPAWVLELCRAKADTGSGGAEGGDSAKEMPLDEAQVADIRAALAHVDNYDRDPWVKVGMALKSTGAGMQAYRLWTEWSATSSKFDEKVQWRQWKSFRQFRWNGTEITLGTLFHLAKQGGWSPSVAATIRESQMVAALAPPKVDGYMPKLRGRREPFPRHLLNIPGVLGELAEWIDGSGLRSQPALALASAIAVCGAIVGRRVATPSNARTNFYMLGVGETASGKEAGVSEPINILKAAGLERFLGVSDWTSDSAIRTSLQANASQVSCVDEFGKWLRKTSGPKCPPHVAGVRKMLLEAFSRAGGVMRGAGYANQRDNPVIDLVEPNICIYGASTPADLFGALDSGAMSDGWMNRFLCVFVDDQVPPLRKLRLIGPERDAARERICASLRRLEEATRPDGNLAGATMDGTTKTGCRLVEWTPEAEAMADAIEERTSGKRRSIFARPEGDDGEGEMTARYSLHVIKLAMLHAVTDDPTRMVEPHDVQWADEFCTWSNGRTMVEIEDRLSDNATHGNVLRLRKMIFDAGPAGLTVSQMSRRTYSISRNERNAALATLVEGGDVESVTRQTGGRPSVTYYGAQYAPKAPAGGGDLNAVLAGTSGLSANDASHELETT